MAISKFTPLTAKKDTGRTIGDNEVAKLANLNRMVDQVNAEFANFNPGGGGLGTLDITTVGTIGSAGYVNYYTRAYYSASASGAQTYEVRDIPNINLSQGGYSGGVSTLSYISFPTLTYADTINISNFSYLETIECPELVGTEGISISNMPNLETVSFAKLQNCATNYGISIGANNPYTLANLSFPLLADAKLTFTNSYIGKSTITSVDFPALTSLGLYVQNAYDLTTINLPNVTKINSQSIYIPTYSSTLMTLLLPNVVEINTYQIYADSAYGLTNVQIGTVGVTKTFSVSGNNPYITFRYCSLNQASVDGVLQLWASLDGTNGTTAVYNGQMYLNNGNNATPSSAGITARNILQNRGWYVATN